MAISFLHGCRPPVIHRDIKPGNLLLTAEGHLKVSDFGLSKIFEGAQLGAYQMTGVTGTLRYMAPEVMRSEHYTEKVDVYSFSFVSCVCKLCVFFVFMLQMCCRCVADVLQMCTVLCSVRSVSLQQGGGPGRVRRRVCPKALTLSSDSSATRWHSDAMP